MCVSSIATPLPVRALVTTTATNGVSSSFYELIINDKSTISSISTLSRGTAVADPLYVAWEASDLSLFPVGYATSLAQKIGVAFTPTASPASAAASRGVSQTGSSDNPSQTGGSGTGSGSNNNPSVSGLSSGTKIGIGVGVGVGAVLLVALIAMAVMIRRLRRRNRAVTTYPNESTPAMEGHEAGVAKNKWFHRARPNEYVENNSGPNELDSFPVHPMHGPPVELEGSYHQIGRY